MPAWPDKGDTEVVQQMILDDIVANKKIELERTRRDVPLEQIQQLALRRQRPLDLAGALRGEGVKIIAEVKKASPSRGLICADFNPVDIARQYAAAGAAAISVLTESQYFQGHVDYLSYIDCALGSVRPPLLRKDFIFDDYQVYESRAFGADALLLIVAILTDRQLTDLLGLSHGLNLQCLVEAHNEEEVRRAVIAGAQIIGINNRDLRTFKVDFETTARLRQCVPAGRVVVSESGIKNRADMQKLAELGVQAALVGETLMTAQSIESKFRELG